MTKLYDNTGIGAPQIAPVAMDQNWAEVEPWHVTQGENHWVFSTADEAVELYVALRDDREKFILDQSRTIGVDAALDLPHPQRPHIYLHTTQIHEQYVQRERRQAERVIAAARRLYRDEKIREMYGFGEFTDCIFRGLDRIQKYFPELLTCSKGE